MADIRVKRNKEGEPMAWLVRWIEDGRQRYKQFRTEAEALDFRKTKERSDFDKMMDAAHGRRPGRYESSGQLWERDRRGVWKMLEQGPGKADEERWSVAGYARRMVEGERELANATRFTYLRTIQRHFEGTPLGQADIRYVTSEQIRDWWAEVPDGGRWDAHRLLSKMLNRAVEVGDREDSPLRRIRREVKKPKLKREIDFDPLTVEQIERLADAAAQRAPGKGFQGLIGEMVRQRDRLLILAMGFAGLRAGEAGGLRRQDLVKTSTGDCQLRVQQQVVRDVPSEPPRVAPVKTKSSKRTVPIPCSLWEELITFADGFGTAADGRIFHGPNGEMRDHSLINGSVRAAARRAGMPGVHSHLLRHSAVSLLIDAGMNPKRIQEFAGHASVTMTLDVYGHLFGAGAELGEAMERLRERHRNGG